MKEINLIPIEYRVVVLMDETEDTFESSIPNLVKPDQTQRDDKRNQKKGLLIEISDCSFSDWDGKRKPKVGDRVECAQYPGQSYWEGDIEYTVMRDRDIVGILKQ